MHIKNWRTYQHYTYRNPPWVKLHKTLLDDPEWHALDGHASKVLAMCWLVASEYDGNLPSIEKLAFRLRMPVDTLRAIISQLNHWVNTDASAVLAPCSQDAIVESSKSKSKSKRKRRKNPPPEAAGHPLASLPGKKQKGAAAPPPAGFDEFWAAYPKKDSKPAAIKAYARAIKKVTFTQMMEALSAQKPRWNPDFTKNPATWLNNECWNDHGGAPVKPVVAL